MQNLYSRSVDDQPENAVATTCLYINMEVLGQISAISSCCCCCKRTPSSLFVASSRKLDIGFRNGSSVVDYKLGSFTQDECCSMCLSNDKCAAASLLDKTHGSHEGCWLQNGANLVPRNAPGVTLCDSQRKDIHSIERVDLKLWTWTNIHTPNAWMDHPLGTTLQAILVQNHGLLSYRAAENAPVLNFAIQE